VVLSRPHDLVSRLILTLALICHQMTNQEATSQICAKQASGSRADSSRVELVTWPMLFKCEHKRKARAC
jgi:hypothetical protein